MADKKRADGEAAASSSGLVSAEEAAQFLGVSARLIWRLRAQGALTVVKFGKKCTRFKRHELARLAETGFDRA